MNGGGRRQLPSWMMRPNATEQAIILETKGENKEDGTVEPPTKAVKPQKKVRTKKDDPAVPLAENKLRGPKQGESRTRKRKSDDPDKGQGDALQEDEPSLLKPCTKSRRKRMSGKRGADLVDDSFDSDVEKKVDGVVKKRIQNNAPRKKHLKMLEEAHKVTEDSCPSEDELTVKDLISIAEEYVKADKDKEFTESKNVEIEPETELLLRADSGKGSEEDLTSHVENRLVNDPPPSSDSSLTKLLSSEGSINKLSTTDDPARDILQMFLGPWLKKSREPEKKIDAITEEKTPDFELNNRSQNDTVAEVAPLMKKKLSLRDTVGRLL